ncbi:hypothetical protein N7541_003276 [Penicillium brevicompactum]|uniref:Haloacid dehalogenase-like hydrolase n=1 Tax=Penicillium brevicompactum TaxID=5074 RepID=A0A9W9RLN9_PENBR|nr:hypothetical protein N7541_003276 [Penicillium brevicompactum]
MNSLTTRAYTLSASTNPRTLLLTLDAFGTLFYPNPPVPEQYATVAHEFGLSRSAFTPEKLEAAFKDVYQAHAKLWPNYGRADVLRGKYGGPRQWWEEVVRESFARVLVPKNSQSSQGPNDNFELPVGMMDVLINRFAGEGGYALFDDVAPFFARMREIKRSPTRQFDRILLGIVSNSDDRVPAVLKALGLRVGNMRADQDLSSLELPGFETRGGSDVHTSNLKGPQDVDLDLVITSYEAGEGKPSRMIFDVAKRQAQLLASNHVYRDGSTDAVVNKTDDWICVHVGDEYEKDYRAALDAGWESYLIPRGNGRECSAKTIASLLDLIEELKIQL